MGNVQDLIGKEVEVITRGTTYRGTLIEVSDTEVHLKTTLQWISLPASSVGQIKLLEKGPVAEAAEIAIDPRSKEYEDQGV